MVLTNFPQGASSFGLPMVGTLPVSSNANYLFVNSVTGSDGNTGAFDQPYATTTQALKKCSANAGDVIVLMEGHAETISAAAGIAINVAGVQIIGLGSGSSRPTFTFATSTAATMTITAANIQISNIVGVTTVDQVVSPFVISGADCWFGLPGAPVEWHDGSAILEAVTGVLTTAGATRLNVNYVYKGFTAGSHCQAGIRLNGVASANIAIDFYGKASTSIVNFITTLSSDVNVTGTFYNSGTTNLSKNVVDTIGSSIWSVVGRDTTAGVNFDGSNTVAIAGSDIATVLADMAVPAANAVTNTLERDVVGNKSDTPVTAVSATNSIMAFVQGLVTMNTVQAANATNDAFAGDVVGNKLDTLIDVVGTTKSLMAYAKGALANLSGAAGIATFPASAAPANAISIAGVLHELYDQADKSVRNTTAVLANGTTLYTIAGGPIQIMELMAICIAPNDVTATTLQFSSTPTVGTPTTFSGASASLASATAGSIVLLTPTALSTAPTIVTAANGGVALGLVAQNHIIVQAGTITTVIATGPSTGTWSFVMRYRPLARGVTVIAT